MVPRSSQCIRALGIRQCFHSHRLVDLVDDLPYDVESGFSEREECGQTPQRYSCDMCYELVDKALHDVRHCLGVFFVFFKSWIPADLADQYLAGAVLLGAAPCTAMVFVWSYLTKGDAAYTLVQVAVNDLIILVAFAPIVALLLGVGGVAIPWATLLLSVLLFVVIPLAAGIVTRICVVRKRGIDYFNNIFIHKFDKVTIIGLLLTLVILFSFQGETILANPLHILLIAVPLIVQTILIFFVAYGWCRYLKLPHDVAAPAGMIGASNFFELAVAVAISLFGLQSGAALATVVGVLVEVPVMLLLVRIANNTRQYFK